MVRESATPALTAALQGALLRWMFPLLLCRLLSNCLSYTIFFAMPASAGHSLLTTSIGHTCGHSWLPTGIEYTCGHRLLTTSIDHPVGNSSLTTISHQTGALDCSEVPKIIKTLKRSIYLPKNTLHCSQQKFTAHGQWVNTAHCDYIDKKTKVADLHVNAATSRKQQIRSSRRTSVGTSSSRTSVGTSSSRTSVGTSSSRTSVILICTKCWGDAMHVCNHKP